MSRENKDQHPEAESADNKPEETKEDPGAESVQAVIRKKKSRAKVKVDSLKLVLVGDAAVGKSAAIRIYLENIFDESYEPTVLDIYKGTR